MGFSSVSGSSFDIRAHLETVANATRDARILVGGVPFSPLLPKSADDLLAFWNAGLSAIALNADGMIIGHAAVEPLIRDWFELGAVWIHPDYRGTTKKGSRHHVGLRLYLAILGAHEEKNILATTVNPAAFVVGWRVDMVPVPYESLPRDVWKATCCCPKEKTGVPSEQNVPWCMLRQNRVCFVRVTRQTFTRMGMPETTTLPVSRPTDTPIITDDGVRIVLSPRVL